MKRLPSPIQVRRVAALAGAAALALLLTAAGCATDSGSREFIPGKGWQPMRK